jgi:hypothetical protein
MFSDNSFTKIKNQPNNTMPQTKKGRKIENAMEKEYGTEKGKQVYFASIVKGKIKGVEGKGGKGTLAKAKKTYKKNH